MDGLCNSEIARPQRHVISSLRPIKARLYPESTLIFHMLAVSSEGGESEYISLTFMIASQVNAVLCSYASLEHRTILLIIRQRVVNIPSVHHKACRHPPIESVSAPESATSYCLEHLYSTIAVNYSSIARGSCPTIRKLLFKTCMYTLFVERPLQCMYTQPSALRWAREADV